MSLIIKENEILKNYTTLKTGGVARFVVTVNSKEDLPILTDLVVKEHLPVIIIGSGSNFLISDGELAGIFVHIKIKGREYYEAKDGVVTFCCGAGEILDEVIEEVVGLGYWGLENLSSIPGTVGATPVQNVGAYGVEIKDIVSEVETYNLLTKTFKKFTNAECKFGYRDSFFKTDEGKNFIITKVIFNLNKNPNPKVDYADLQKKFFDSDFSLSDIREEVINIRSNKFPDWKVLGTAGSFFKNPIIAKEAVQTLVEKYPDLPSYHIDENNVKLPLGFVLDKICNLKGYRVGNVGLYEKQALVLVNYGEANAEEIKNFVNEISTIVVNKTGIKIEPEVRFVF